MKVCLRKIGGFYHVFDNDAIIIHYFFNYKIQNKKTGFPISALVKVKNLLEEKSISYNIDNEDEVDFKGNNEYDLYLKKGELLIKKEYRLRHIDECLEEMNEKQLGKLLRIIEKYIVSVGL